MDKQSFVFYIDWHLCLQRLQPDVRLKMYDAICSYVFDKVSPDETDPIVYALFPTIQGTLDRDREKYEQTCKKRTEAINKRWNEYKSKQSIQDDTKEYNSIQKNTNRTDNGNDNLNENEKENKIISSSDEDVSQSSDSDSSVHVNYDGIVKFWNQLVEHKALPQLTGIKEGTNRRKLVQARIKQYGKEAFAKALRNAAASEFLNGANKRSKVFSFDWIICPNNFPKVLEGNYEESSKTTDSKNLNNIEYDDF